MSLSLYLLGQVTYLMLTSGATCLELSLLAWPTIGSALLSKVLQLLQPRITATLDIALALAKDV